jgi:acetyl-CoA synthetase (ADP-forming)
MEISMASSIIQGGLKRGWLLEPEAKELCKEYGLPVGMWRVATTSAEAMEAAGALGFPIVAKIVSSDVIHKSDVGGVILNLKDEKDVEAAFLKIKSICEGSNYRFEGVLVEPQAPPGIETIIGAKRDPQFGPVLLFGLGGIFVEVFKDVSFRVAPIEREDAVEMISELKALPLLKGIRGKKPSDFDALVDSLLKVSDMMVREERIKELDLNPTLAYEKGCRIVDARVILS